VLYTLVNLVCSHAAHDKLSLKWVCSRHVIHLKFQSRKHTSRITEAGIVQFLTQVGYI